MNDGKIKFEKLGIQLPEGLHQVVKAASAQRGIDVKEAYEQAMRAWLGTAAPPPPPAPRAVPGAGRWQHMLNEVLASGNKKAIEAVTRNLTVFYDYIKLASEARAKRRPKKSA